MRHRTTWTRGSCRRGSRTLQFGWNSLHTHTHTASLYHSRLMALSLTFYSSRKEEALLCQWCFSSLSESTSSVCDSSNLEIRLAGVLFISEQSFKELREGAQSAADSALAREDARSLSAALHSALILFSRQRRSTHSSSETRETHGTSVYPSDDKGARMEQDGSEEEPRRPRRCSLRYVLTKHATAVKRG